MSKTQPEKKKMKKTVPDVAVKDGEIKEREEEVEDEEEKEEEVTDDKDLSYIVTSRYYKNGEVECYVYDKEEIRSACLDEIHGEDEGGGEEEEEDTRPKKKKTASLFATLALPQLIQGAIVAGTARVHAQDVWGWYSVTVVRGVVQTFT